MALYLESYLSPPVRCISESCMEIKNKSNFYFHTSLWCLKTLYEGLSFSSSEIGTGRVKNENENIPRCGHINQFVVK